MVSGVCSSGPQASCPAALQSLSSCWCELQVDPWEAVAAAVWGLISQAASCAEESLLSQPSPRCGWLHLTGRSANLEMTAMTRTLPHAHGSGWRWGCPLPFTPGDGDAGSFPKAPAWAASVLRAMGSSPLPSHSPLSFVSLARLLGPQPICGSVFLRTEATRPAGAQCAAPSHGSSGAGDCSPHLPP